jgi:hypothetical protein
MTTSTRAGRRLICPLAGTADVSERRRKDRRIKTFWVISAFSTTREMHQLLIAIISTLGDYFNNVKRTKQARSRQQTCRDH